MTSIAKVICLFFACSYGVSVSAAPLLRLLCTGEITTTTDLQPKEVDRVALNVTIDTDKKFIEIPEDWSCFADIGNVSNPNLRQACLGRLPLTIRDAEFVFFSESDGPWYKGQATLTINRYSGTLVVSSIASAKPAARAMWSIMHSSGSLTCTTPAKKF